MSTETIKCNSRLYNFTYSSHSLIEHFVKALALFLASRIFYQKCKDKRVYLEEHSDT